MLFCPRSSCCRFYFYYWGLSILLYRCSLNSFLSHITLSIALQWYILTVAHITRLYHGNLQMGGGGAFNWKYRVEIYTILFIAAQNHKEVIINNNVSCGLQLHVTELSLVFCNCFQMKMSIHITTKETLGKLYPIKVIMTQERCLWNMPYTLFNLS